MRKKKPSIYEHTWEDGEFITTATREFALSYPDELDDVLRRINEWTQHPESEPGLTPLEHIIRQFEKEAMRLLQKYEESQSIVEPIEVLSARQVLYSSETLRESIAMGEAEQAAVEMIKLVFSAITADIHNVLMTGIRARHGQIKGGRASKRKEGISLAIWEIVKRKPDLSRAALWQYFAKKHNQDKGQEVFRVRGYGVYYEGDRLFQESSVIDNQEPKSISKSTFYQYVTRVKKLISK